MALIRSCLHALIISLAGFKLFIIHQVGSVTISAITLVQFCVMETAHVYYTLVVISANMLMATVKVTVNMSGLFCF